MTTVPPIRREVLVDADPETAFEVFTSDIGKWWPLGDFSVYGEGATVAFTKEEIVERSPTGESALWGTVSRWEPPDMVAFSWHPGRAPEKPSYVEVTFKASEGRTLVTLEHSGWEVFDDSDTAREEYGKGWPKVLGHYADRVGKHEGSADG